MGTIRHAQSEDLDALSEIGTKFLQYSRYGKMVDPSSDDIRDGIKVMLDHGCVVVAEVDGKVVGAIGGTPVNLWFSRTTPVVAELAWWVNEEYRNGSIGVKLLWAFEDWAQSIGARAICLSDLALEDGAPVSKILSKLGYSMVEQAHIKEF